MSEDNRNSIEETVYVLATHGGVELIESADSARRGEYTVVDLGEDDE